MAVERKHDPLDDGWMSLYAASKALGKPRLTVMKYVLQGALEAENKAGRTLLSRESVEKLRTQLQEAGAA